MDGFYCLTKSVKSRKKELWEEYCRNEQEIVIKACTFEDVVFSEYAFQKVMFMNCTFARCKFFNCDFSELRMQQTRFLNCIFKKISLRNHGRLVYVQMNECKFYDCDIPELLYSNKNKQAIKFKSCSRTKKKTSAGTKILKRQFFDLDTVILFQKHGRNIYNTGQRCQICRLTAEKLHFYRNTSVGEIEICKDCQDKLLDKCFGKIDAMSRAVQGGGFSPR